MVSVNSMRYTPAQRSSIADAEREGERATTREGEKRARTRERSEGVSLLEGWAPLKPRGRRHVRRRRRLLLSGRRLLLLHGRRFLGLGSLLLAAALLRHEQRPAGARG